MRIINIKIWSAIVMLMVSFFSGSEAWAESTSSNPLNIVKEGYDKYLEDTVTSGKLADDYIKQLDYELDVVFKKATNLRIRKSNSSAQNAIRILNKNIGKVDGDIKILLNGRLSSFEKIGNVAGKADKAAVALDVLNDLSMLQNRIDQGSSAAAESLNILLKVVQTKLPSIPGMPSPSDIGRAMLDLVAELKTRNISLSNLMQQRNAQVTHLAVDDLAIIQADLCKFLASTTSDFDGTYHYVYDNRIKYIGELIDRYRSDIKDFENIKSDGVADPLWFLTGSAKENEAFINSIISGTNLNIGILKQEMTKLKTMEAQGVGYDLVVEYAQAYAAKETQRAYKEAEHKRLEALLKLKEKMEVLKIREENSFKVQLSVNPKEITAGGTVEFLADSNRPSQVESMSLTVVKDNKDEIIININDPKKGLFFWKAQYIFDQPGIRTITAKAKHVSGTIVSSQPVTLTVKAGAAMPPSAAVTAVSASKDAVEFGKPVDFIATVNGTLGADDKVVLALDAWSTEMKKTGNRWQTTLDINEAVNGKRNYFAYVINGKTGLKSAATQPKQLTVLSPVSIQSVAAKMNGQPVTSCKLYDYVDFFVTTSGANSNDIVKLKLDSWEEKMQTSDGKIWHARVQINEASGGKRNYTAYAIKDGTQSAIPSSHILNVVARTGVASVEAYMGDQPTSTFSSGTPIKFVVKLNGQTNGKVVVMLDSFRMEVAKPGTDGTWTASAPIWDKEGKTRSYWAYVEEGGLSGPVSQKKTLTSNSDQPNRVECGPQNVKSGDEIRLKVTKGNGGYNLVGTVAGDVGGPKPISFSALNVEVWQWAQKINTTKQGMLTVKVNIEDKPSGGKVIDTFTCAYAVNGAELPITPKVPEDVPHEIIMLDILANTGMTETADSEIPIKVFLWDKTEKNIPSGNLQLQPIRLRYGSRELVLTRERPFDATVWTTTFIPSRDFGVKSTETRMMLELVNPNAPNGGESRNVELKFSSEMIGREALVKDQASVQELYNKFKTAYSSRNEAALRGLLSDDWQSESDGTTLSDLEDNLRRSFKLYNQITYTIGALSIESLGNRRFKVSYAVEIKGTIFQNNITHVEQSGVVEEVMVDENGKAKIVKTLDGRFWVVK